VSRHATATTACSADLARRVNVFGQGAEAIRIPYGVDTKRFAPLAPTERAAARARMARAHSLRPDALWVFAIGRLVYKKGFDVLAKAVGSAVGDGTDVEVIVAGAGPLESELRQLAARQGAAERMHWIGAVRNVDVPNYYAACDVVAVPSVHGPDGNVDGLPNTLLEALSSGAAVVASDVAGIPDVVRHADNGLLFPEADVDALATYITSLSRDAEMLKQLGARARADALEKLDWVHTVARFEQVYESVGTTA